MSSCDLSFCSFRNWYSQFAHLTIESKVIEMPGPVYEYLRSDRFFLPPCVFGQSENRGDKCSTQLKGNCSTAKEATRAEEEMLVVGKQVSRNSDSSGDSEPFGEGIDDTESSREFELMFSRFALVLEGCFNDYGSIFPKLIWKAPSDASWISTSGLRCFVVEDVILLLKSSTRIADVYATFDAMNEREKSSPYMVARKWKDINPRGEYRCFIRDRTIVAFCQRHVDLCVSPSDIEIASLREKMFDFFECKILPNVQEGNCPRSFTMDIYYDDRMGSYQLLDFGVFTPEQPEDSLLFDWREIEEFVPETKRDVLMRFRSAGDCMVGGSSYPYPLEAVYGKLVDLAREGQTRQPGDLSDDTQSATSAGSPQPC